MSFSTPSPPPFVAPPPPIPAPPLQPASERPLRKPMQPSMVSMALAPTQQQTQQSQRSLIGGTPTALGA